MNFQSERDLGKYIWKHKVGRVIILKDKAIVACYKLGQ